ncbi:MAG TPA: Ig-like domain-containing protein [Gammaproteobacteria bacterium]|nr:Ig-like domain-containing protein [Gammaproteobacteria bacterium]
MIATVLLTLWGCGGGGYSYGSSSSGSSGSSTGGGISTITLSPTSSTIAVGATQQFTATAKNANGTTVSGVTYTWKSSDTNVATVDANGLATGVAAGTTKISAIYKYSISGVSYSISSNQATLTVSATGMVAGIAAVGHALSGALITFKDSQGQVQFADTDSNGRFTLATAGFRAPFLLKATDSQGDVMYSIATGDGNVNIDPLSSVVAQLWYLSHGSSIQTALADPQQQPRLLQTSLAALDRALAHSLSVPLASHGLDSTAVSLLNTPFTANGSGLDGVLDQTSVVNLRNGFVVSNRSLGIDVMLQATHNMITIRTANRQLRTVATQTVQTD